MRFLMMWHPADNAASQNPPPAGLMAAIDELMAEIVQKGALIDAGGMSSVSQGGRLRLQDGKITPIDGPFAEAKEVIGGYCIVRTDTKAEALDMARRFLEVHQTYGYEGESELRQLLSPEEFDPTAA